MQYKDFWFANGSEAGPLTYQFRPSETEKTKVFLEEKIQEFADD